MKLFIGEGEQEGKVFLNLNPVLKQGQFSIKDPEYGDIVLAQLVRLLQRGLSAQSPTCSRPFPSVKYRVGVVPSCFRNMDMNALGLL